MKAAAILAILILSSASWFSVAASPAGKPVTKAAAATALMRDSARCSARGDIDACYDAIRWNPGDPALLVALGDALLRAQRPVDALRYYHRAAALAPATRGIAAKISAAEANAQARRAPRKPAGDRGALSVAAGKHFSNAEPVTQSH